MVKVYQQLRICNTFVRVPCTLYYVSGAKGNSCNVVQCLIQTVK